LNIFNELQKHHTSKVLKKASCRLLKKIQRRGARKSTSEGVLTVRRSEAIERQRSIWVFFSSLLGMSLLMSEVSHPGKDHRHAVFIGGGDDFIVFDGTARLDH
jgi:predicted Holliday junction resolvase-like endonuclease